MRMLIFSGDDSKRDEQTREQIPNASRIICPLHRSAKSQLRCNGLECPLFNAINRNAPADHHNCGLGECGLGGSR